MKKTVILLILFVLLVIVALFISNKGDIRKEKDFTNNSNNSPNEIPNPEEDANSTKEGVSNEEQNQVAVTGEAISPLETTNPTPADMNAASCGSYYLDYDICAGTCPEGKCVNEGRSCYCKR